MNVNARSCMCAGIVLMAAAVMPGFRLGGLTGEEILRKVEGQVERVKDYTVTLDVVADVERMKVPPMHATMYYKYPDKVHFDAKGFAMLPRESMGLQFGHLSQQYAVDSVQHEGKGTPVLYRLVMHPRDERSNVRRILLWVDGDRWTPDRLEIPNADGRIMQAAFTYGSFGGCWLPTELTVRFSMASHDSTAVTPANPFTQPNPPARSGQRGNQRQGTVTVRYSDYRVNTGLADELFEQPAEQKK
jgi:outer membrane lipoprotein-sorting protein